MIHGSRGLTQISPVAPNRERTVVLVEDLQLGVLGRPAGEGPLLLGIVGSE